MKAELPHLLLAVDLGGSGTKIVGGVQELEDAEQVLIMMPHCIEVKNTDELLFNLDFDQHDTWVKIGGMGYAVGNLAATKFNATNKLKPAKFTMAVPKICAAIAVFTQLFKLPAKFNLSLTFVLPPAEWEQRTIVIERLQAALKDLDTPRGKIKPKLLSISGNPEGMGVLLGQGLDLKELANITVVMIGHRNASVFATKFGVMNRPQSSDLGFNTILKDISSKTGYALDDLISPIYEYDCFNSRLIETNAIIANYSENDNAKRSLADCEKDVIECESVRQKYLNFLLKCSGADRELESRRLIEIIARAKIDYVSKLTDWLDENMESRLDQLCLCGGASKILVNDIKPFLISKVKFNHENRFVEHLSLSRDAQQLLGYGNRYHDIYFLYLQLQADIYKLVPPRVQ